MPALYVLLIIVLIVIASYVFVYGIFRIFAKQIDEERKKNEMLIDAITAKNITERTKKKIIDARIDAMKKRLEKQPELPGITADEKQPVGPTPTNPVPSDELE